MLAYITLINRLAAGELNLNNRYAAKRTPIAGAASAEHSRIGRVALIAAIVLSIAAVAQPGTAHASYSEVYCAFCSLPNGTWVAHSSVFKNYDDNIAADCSSETNCGAWHTCVSMHDYGTEILYISRVCSSTGAATQGWSYNHNFSTGITSWCENDGGAAHHQDCATDDYE